MKNLKFLLNDEKGQVIPAVVIMLFAIIAMAALLLDGGTLMMNKRSAQVAADAGALAGAKLMCAAGYNPTTVLTTASSYATENHATNAVPSILTKTIDGKNAQVIQMNTSVKNSSFFSRIFGYSELNSNAVAQAGCFSTCEAKGMLPVSWSCKAPVGGSDSKNCQLLMLDWATEMKPLVTGTPNPVYIHDLGLVNTPLNFKTTGLTKFLYIIVDSQKTSDDVSSTCAPAGNLICDINGDGINEVFGGGDRSWLDLSGGGGGASDLSKWITDGFSGTIGIHTWLGGQTGVATSVYHSINDVIDRYPPKYPVVLLPVFDGLCDANPNTKPSCMTVLHNPVPAEEKVVYSSGAANYYHIAGFSTFYLTCVDDGGANKCPGAKEFIKVNPSLKNLKTIEGYFVKDYPWENPTPCTGGVDVGINVVTLIQ